MKRAACSTLRYCDWAPRHDRHKGRRPHRRSRGTGEFTAEATIVDEEGLTVAWRGDDRKTQISVELIAKTSAIPVLGATFTLTVNTASSYAGGTASTAFSGWVTKVSDKGSNRGYTAVTVTAVGYEAIV